MLQKANLGDKKVQNYELKKYKEVLKTYIKNGSKTIKLNGTEIEEYKLYWYNSRI